MILYTGVKLVYMENRKLKTYKNKKMGISYLSYINNNLKITITSV